MDSGGNEEFIPVSTFDKRRDIFSFFYEGNLLEYCVSGHVYYAYGYTDGVAVK